MSPLQLLPDDLVVGILCFVGGGDAKSLLRCGKTCRKLYHCLQNDKVWQESSSSSPSEDSSFLDHRLTSYREQACIQMNVERSINEQNRTGNILLEELGLEDLEMLASAVGKSILDRSICVCDHGRFSTGINHGPGCHYRDSADITFVWKRDTLSALLVLTQAAMIDRLLKTNCMVCQRVSDQNKYPILSAEDLLFMCAIHENETSQPVPWNGSSALLSVVAVSKDVVDAPTRDRIIRRLSLRSGVVRMSNDAYESGWRMLIDMLDSLLRRGCVSFDVARGNISDFETIPVETSSSSEQLPCTLDRQHIEDAARDMKEKFPYWKIYGGEWLIRNEEMAIETDMVMDDDVIYLELPQDDHSDGDEDSDGDDDEESLESFQSDVNSDDDDFDSDTLEMMS